MTTRRLSKKDGETAKETKLVLLHRGKHWWTQIMQTRNAKGESKLSCWKRGWKRKSQMTGKSTMTKCLLYYLSIIKLYFQVTDKWIKKGSLSEYKTPKEVVSGRKTCFYFTTATNIFYRPDHWNNITITSKIRRKAYSANLSLALFFLRQNGSFWKH